MPGGERMVVKVVPRLGPPKFVEAGMVVEARHHRTGKWTTMEVVGEAFDDDDRAQEESMLRYNLRSPEDPKVRGIYNLDEIRIPKDKATALVVRVGSGSCVWYSRISEGEDRACKAVIFDSKPPNQHLPLRPPPFPHIHPPHTDAQAKAL